MFVPIILSLFPILNIEDQRVNCITWLSAIIGTFSLFLMSGCTPTSCFTSGFKVGEMYAFCGMVCWCFQCISVTIAIKHVDVFQLLSVSFIITIILNVFTVMLFDNSSKREFVDLSHWKLIVIYGCASLFAYVLAYLAQLYVHPLRAMLLYAFNSVVCATLGYLILHEGMTYIELTGCALMFFATALSNIFTTNNDSQTLEIIDSDTKRMTKENVLGKSQAIFENAAVIEKENVLNEKSPLLGNARTCVMQCSDMCQNCHKLFKIVFIECKMLNIMLGYESFH